MSEKISTLMSNVDLSIVIPAYDEQESIVLLYEQIKKSIHKSIKNYANTHKHV